MTLPTEEQFGAELAALRKGMGMRRPALMGRVGPGLRDVCGLDETATHTDARTALTTVLRRATEALPAPLDQVARVMLAIEPDYVEPTLTGRQNRLAAAMGVDPVTVRRRCDLALRLLGARLADGRSVVSPMSDDPYQSTEWYTISSSGTLRLDVTRPEVTCSLTVAALRDGLDGVELGVGVPRPRNEPRPRMGLDVEVQFGGDLMSSQQVSAEYFLYRVAFPRPLRRGETHTFGTVTRIPAGQQLAPHFVSWTRRRVDRLEVRVRFDRARLPRAVWGVNRARFSLSEADGPSGETLTVDAVGEVAVAYDRLVLGLGYGVAWLPRLPDPV